MSSQGQRFRRRALRRGYKVDEVDSFLDRVEATLAGEQVGPPVGAQEVHDVVFRVRFGGYDEWQVDLHLDRVERQLAEFEERGGGRALADPRMEPEPMRGGMPMDRSGMPMDRMGPATGGAAVGGAAVGGASMGQYAPPTERLQAPIRDDRMPVARDDRMAQHDDDRMTVRRDDRMPARDDRMPARDDRMPARDDRMPGRGDDLMPVRDDRMPGRGDDRMPVREDRMPMRGDDRMPGGRDDRPMSAPPMPQRAQQVPAADPYGRYDEPLGYGPQGYGQPQRPAPGGYDTGSYDAFEPGRHGKADMTAEIRLPERDRGYGGPSPMSGPPLSGPPLSGSQMPLPMSAPPMGGGLQAGGGQDPELHRVDQLRRTFQPRRFGSGYDPMQVDRLFDGIMQALTGRGPMPVPESELDIVQFGLVPGGYFEAEVDQALREVKDILLRRR